MDFPTPIPNRTGRDACRLYFSCRWFEIRKPVWSTAMPEMTYQRWTCAGQALHDVLQAGAFIAGAALTCLRLVPVSASGNCYCTSLGHFPSRQQHQSINPRSASNASTNSSDKSFPAFVSVCLASFVPASAMRLAARISGTMSMPQ